MINIDPASSFLPSSQKFYKDLGKSLGLPIGSATVTPFSQSGDFSAVGVSGDVYFDIGNVALGNITFVNIKPKPPLYIGNLKCAVYMPNFSVAGSYSFWLSKGIPSILINQILRNEQLLATTNGVVNNNNLIDQDVVFELLRLNVTGAGNVIQVEFDFDGVRLDW